ncbi:ankyrin repeat domain-containing protein [Endozoicomonas ascidiicola]|uniref:ankyrin repeat domain-containing protein n=1 Tax=Endozoicomonas ascidiicola TaxID=1698521 RepID=UPI0008302FBF|nr:ankyrin repeat domain-containing protein [Endozoicomonas ascidiicola]
MVEELINHGADPMQNNPHANLNSHALFIAAQENHADVIHAIAKSEVFAPDKPRGDGTTAMFMAIQYGNTQAVDALLTNNASPNAEIQYASHTSGGIAPISEGDVIPPAESQVIVTPVYLAAEKGKTDILELLLSKGGHANNIAPENPIQRSPLASAILGPNCQEKVVELLLKHGAKIHEPMPAQTTTQRIITLSQWACIQVADQTPESKKIAQLFCDYHRTPAGQKMSYEEFQRQFSIEGTMKVAAFDTQVMENLLKNLLKNQDSANSMRDSVLALINHQLGEMLASSGLSNNEQDAAAKQLRSQLLPQIEEEMRQLTPEEWQMMLQKDLKTFEQSGVNITQFLGTLDEKIRSVDHDPLGLKY